MKDEQVQAWRSGDATATTAVRNGLRALADGLLATPGLGLPEPHRSQAEHRRELASQVAREVMQRGGASADELLGLAVMVAARQVIQALRESRVEETGLGHLPPQLVVSYALAADSLSAHARQMCERHLGECAGCEAEVERIRKLLRVGLQGPAPSPEPSPVRSAPAELPPDAPTQEVRRPPRAGAEPSRPADPPPERAEPRDPRRGPADPRSPTAREKPGTPRAFRAQHARPSGPSALATWWPVLAIAAVLLTMVLLRHQERDQARRRPEIAALADRSPPSPVPAARLLPAEASGGLHDLKRGDCKLGAMRLGTARQFHPQHRELAWLEARSWVCAGEGERAEAALQAFLDAGGQVDAEVLWTQGQIALLKGDLRLALDRLVRVRPLLDLERGRKLDEQLDRLRSYAR